MGINSIVRGSDRYFGAAVATNGSLAVTPMFSAPVNLQITGAKLINGNRTSIASSANAVTVTVYKNASSTASKVASLSNSASEMGSTNTTMSLTSTTANQKLASGDILLIEATEANSGAALASGWMVQVEYTYGYYD